MSHLNRSLSQIKTWILPMTEKGMDAIICKKTYLEMRLAISRRTQTLQHPWNATPPNARYQARKRLDRRKRRTVASQCYHNYAFPCRLFINSSLCQSPFSSSHEERQSVLPVPHFFEKVAHVDSSGLHFYHPRMFQHPPWSGAPVRFLFETVMWLACAK